MWKSVRKCGKIQKNVENLRFEPSYFCRRFKKTINKTNMKKFLTDNIHWIALGALVLAGFAVWKITKGNKKTDNGNDKDNTGNTAE